MDPDQKGAYVWESSKPYYWKEARELLTLELESFHSCFLLLSNSSEFGDFIHFFNSLPSAAPVILVSTSRTFESLKPYFNHLTTRNIHVIDCISKTLFTEVVENQPNCTFLNYSPSFEEVINKIIEISRVFKNGYIVVDSISSFVNLRLYNERATLHTYIDKIKKIRERFGNKTILIAREGRDDEIDIPGDCFDSVMKLTLVKTQQVF